MIKLQLIKELKRRVPWILTTYGGVETFISYVKESLKISRNETFKSLTPSQKVELFNFLNLILKYENDILLLSPWNLFIDLRLGINSNKSINIEEPYQVFNLNGDLLYTVRSHLGVFGESRLDKNLILNSVNTSGYFLKYKNYLGQPNIKFLLINLHSKNSTVSNQDFRILEENTISNLSIINNTGRSIPIFKTDSTLNTSSNFIYNRPENLQIIKNNDMFTFNVTNSCYLLIEEFVTLTQTKITYPDSNIVFIKDASSPIFVGSNIDVTLLNRMFNTVVQYSNKPLDDVITLTS